MGSYISRPGVPIREKKPLVDIYVKVTGFSYEYSFHYDNLVEPHCGKLESFNNEILAIIRALEYLPALGIDFQEIVLHTSPSSISYISDALYHRSDNLILLHFADKNIRMVENK
jgi:hypothetical protein